MIEETSDNVKVNLIVISLEQYDRKIAVSAKRFIFNMNLLKKHDLMADF